MNKSLPKKSEGFTLIELLVVVAIIAILTLIAISTYAGVVKKGRDSRRQEEIDSMAKSIEVRKDTQTGNYVYLAADYAQDYPPQSKKPQDPQGVTSYCIMGKASPIVSTDIPSPATWDPTTGPACPGSMSPIPVPAPTATTGIDVIGGTGPVGGGAIPGVKHWLICARLETSVNVFCKSDLSN